MDRRNFLRTMLGVAAATALPSEVFPFRKIFLPAAPEIIAPPLLLSSISAIELESFAHQIPDLFFNPSPFFSYISRCTPTARGIEVHSQEVGRHFGRLRFDLLDPFETPKDCKVTITS